MNPDELKTAWRAQTSQARLTIDVDLLLKEVQRNQKTFVSMIFWRDVREVGVCLLMVPVLFYVGVKVSLPWAWYLMVPAMLWIAGFMLVDRLRHNRRPPEPGEPLSRHVELSLAQVEHQIWLLRNVLWWYLLPPGLTALAVFGQCGWLARDGGWLIALIVSGLAAGTVLLYAGLYWLNQRYVRSQLEPRHRELQALLGSLKGTAEGGGSVAGPDEPAPKSKNMTWPSVAGIILLFVLSGLLSVWAHRAGKSHTAVANSGYCPAAGDPAVTNLLVSIRQKHGVSAIAAVNVTSKGLLTQGVAGVRKRGTEVPATLNDQWHLGSDGKAMTATLVARLVEKERLKWDTTVAEVFPDLAPGFNPEARTITVLQLLSHRSGLRPNPDLLLYRGADGTKERLRLVKDELKKAPQHKPGAHYEYSNLGYAIVGAIVERITGKSFEEAIQDEVFRPLGMSSVGFGGTGTPGITDQPWGHYENGAPVPDNGPAMDNPPVLCPAGRIHCTIQDWARFITDQLRGARGEPALLQPATYQKLQTPPFGGEYALGWLVVEREWGGGTVLNHGGDNTMNFANVWVAPRRDFAILVCVNQSGNTAFEATDEAVGALMDLETKKAQPAEAAP